MVKLLMYVNNKVADQPAHSRSLVSSFVIHPREGMIAVHDAFKFSRL